MSVARKLFRGTKFQLGMRPSRKPLAAQGDAFNLESCEPRWLLSATSIIQPELQIVPDRAAVSIQGYTPAQLKKAYGFTGLRATGAGQTIAIVDAYNDPSVAADLAVFDKEFGLSAPPSLSIVSQTGGSVRGLQTDAGWAGEIALDVEWAHAIAPGANIVVVEANSDSEQDLMAAASYARSIRNVSVVSMSWGENEDYSQTQYDSIFTTPSGHIGVTFVAASGDDGAAGGAEYPASSPNVLAVGGTTLNLSSSGGISSETAWSDTSGGESSVESAPSYQTAVTGNTARTTPDVSYDADPNTGVAVYASVPYEGIVGWQEVGGTSAGTPQWAGIIALADQVRAANRLPTLNGQTQTLPALYSLYASPSSSNYSTYTRYFNDITSGSNGGGFFEVASDAANSGVISIAAVTPSRRHGGFGGGASAAAGYDTLTGLGSPKAYSIVTALVSWGSKSISAARTGRAAATSESAAVRRQDVVVVAAPMEPTPVISDAALAAAAQSPSRSPSAAFSRQPISFDEPSSVYAAVALPCSSQQNAQGFVLAASPAPRADFSGVAITNSSRSNARVADPAAAHLVTSASMNPAGAAHKRHATWTASDDALAIYDLSAGLVLPSSPLDMPENRLTGIRWISAVAATASVACIGFLSGYWQKRRRVARREGQSRFWQKIER